MALILLVVLLLHYLFRFRIPHARRGYKLVWNANVVKTVPKDEPHARWERYESKKVVLSYYQPPRIGDLDVEYLRVHFFKRKKGFYLIFNNGTLAQYNRCGKMMYGPEVCLITDGDAVAIQGIYDRFKAVRNTITAPASIQPLPAA
jgi:hypothetical protein